MKKTIILLVMLFLPALLWFAYDNGRDVPPPEHMNDMTKEQMIEDYEVFWDILEKYHGSLEALDKGEVQKIKDRYALKIRQMTGNDARQYLDYYIRTINKLNGIGHLNIVSEGIFKELEAFNPTADHNYPNYDKLLSDTKAKETARWINELYMFQDIGTPSGAKAQLEHIDEEISYIKIPSFSNVVMDEQGPLVSKWIEEHVDDKAMIFDIRGNGGGNDLFWYKYILPYVIEEDIVLTNYFFIKDWPTEPDFSSIKTRYEEAKATEEDIAYVKALPAFDANEMFNHGTLYKSTTIHSVDKEEKQFDGDIYILTDMGTGSAAANMAILFKRADLGTVVGTFPKYSSGGLGEGLSPVVFTLPNSRISYMFRLQYLLNDDGSCAQISIIEPDYIEEKDAFDLCLELIREK